MVNMLIIVNWKIIKINQIKNCMSKLLKEPHGEKSPLASSLEVNSHANALAAAHPHYHKNNPRIKLLKKMRDLDKI